MATEVSVAGEKKLGEEGTSCLACGNRHWTPYQIEDVNGEWEEAWELCQDCSLIIPEKRKETREDRGIQLAKAHFDEIVKIRPWTWSVPSCSGRGSYEVNLKHQSCSCPDAEYRSTGEPCKHSYALSYVLAKSGQCAGCRKRFWWRDLIEVQDWHESMTWFPGDLLCQGCARATGVA